MDHHVGSSHVHADGERRAKEEDVVVVLAVDAEAADPKPAEADDRPGDGEGGVNYMARAQWLRAAVLGANDGLVSVASLMIGVSAVNDGGKTMLVSGLAGLVAGACSMAIGEFVSVYAQYDIEVAQIKRDGAKGKKESLASPTLAALASALAFAVGALLPLLAGGFVRPYGARVGAVCAATTVGLAGFGAAGGYLGGASMLRSGSRVLLGGWVAMAVTYGVLWLFAKVSHIQVSSLG
ncbi:vacuolar iron transporter homolog 2-like [Triticum urartu]|uniref:vacuolar iron transporter homolog 2-like n=1 Tax=Triticum dicoccoides TaxID=85692 RepID=UPI00162C494F|nr:vacuolar iron transporter homolog 2-like [Triticum dicoccoides]XP_048553095.1 vacuolar iron transporter homolog 2-like [Triticum urartu]